MGTDWTDPAAVRRLLEKQEKSDPGSTELADTITKLADLFFIKDNYFEAEALYWRALEIRQKRLGEGHEDTAASLRNLAELYEIQDRYAEAERFYAWSASAKKKALLVKHSDRMDRTQDINDGNLMPSAAKMRQVACELCKRPLLDQKVCMYCTQSGFDARKIIAEALKNAPAKSATGADVAVNILIDAANGKQYRLDDTEVGIGRHPSNTIVLSTDKYVSRYHAIISYAKGHFWIEDKNTINGTYVNSEAIKQKVQLRPSDTITIGRTTLRADSQN